MAPPIKLLDQQQYILDWLTRNGSSRCKAMYDKASPTIRNGMSQQLGNMYKRGQIDRRQDGVWRGRQVWLYAMPGIWEARSAEPEVSFGGAATLAGFQTAARAAYGVHVFYIDRLKQAA
jgi:hypothetical protein